MLTIAKETTICSQCNGDGAVLTHIPNETQSIYGWAGYVPCPCCGGCGHVVGASETRTMAGHNSDRSADLGPAPLQSPNLGERI